jgi:hypothetical protein
MITYIKCAEFICEMKTGKTYWGIGQVGERQREQIREEKDLVLVESGNGVG